jgi:hypothetical protein
VRPEKIVLQIGTPLTFESVTNHAAGWRQICAVIREKTVALQACRSPISTSHQDDLMIRVTATVLRDGQTQDQTVKQDASIPSGLSQRRAVDRRA